MLRFCSPLGRRASIVAPVIVCCCLGAIGLQAATEEGVRIDPRIPLLSEAPAEEPPSDFLIDSQPFKATASHHPDSQEIVLSNGLIRRTWKVGPNGACVGFDNLMTGESMLRSVRPEARVAINGTRYDVGGLVGQPNHAYLTPEWLAEMQATSDSFRLVNVVAGEPQERFAWGRKRRASPEATWPPKGVYLRMDYVMPRPEHLTHRLIETLPSEVGRTLLIQDEFASLDNWDIHTTKAHERSSLQNEGKAGEITTPANTAAYAERPLPSGTKLVELMLDVGTDRSASWGPGLALVFDDRVVKFYFRPGGDAESSEPAFGLWDGQQERLRLRADGPLDISTPWHIRLRQQGSDLFCEAKPAGGQWVSNHRVSLPKSAGEARAVRVGKLDRQGGPADHHEPGELVRLRLMQFSAYDEADPAQVVKQIPSDDVRVSVHYELYDGIPAMSKWVTVHNHSEQSVLLESFSAEELAVVEQVSWVEAPDGVSIPAPDYLHVETDFAFGGFDPEVANRHVVHWRSDPLYTSQVNYARRTPCLLVVEPTYGPAQRIEPGKQFESFRVFELVYDHGNRERRGLALRRFYRTVAPWVTENPIMHHLLSHDPARVREAIDEAAEVGFESIILSFGSGFNIENRNPDYLRRWKAVAEHAKEKEIELGVYSLFSSRNVGAEHMIVSPPGQRPTHGQCPAVTSAWGQQWLATVEAFYRESGFSIFENDGPYPGDVDVTARPPFQQGIQDSRWVQWLHTVNLYRNLRGNGVYINAPDHYYLNGSNKCGMGYREVNWSLPRDHQVIHTRQNIYDGTWSKTPSMGWMFVPLTQYHGGGAAATIEPLNEHIDHYRLMLQSNLGMGVQACFRGPRLYDTPAVREMVAAEVAWFKEYRDILESDIVHGRRADGRDIDWVLHVNPQLPIKGMLCVYNPLPVEVQRTIYPSLYYTGLNDKAEISHEAGPPVSVELDKSYQVPLKINLPAKGMTWYLIR